MSRNLYDPKPDRNTVIERRGLIVLAILVCVTLLAIAAWRSGQLRTAEPAPLTMEELPAAVPTDTAKSEKSSEKPKDRKKKGSIPKPPIHNSSPLDRPLR